MPPYRGNVLLSACISAMSLGTVRKPGDSRPPCTFASVQSSSLSAPFRSASAEYIKCLTGAARKCPAKCESPRIFRSRRMHWAHSSDACCMLPPSRLARGHHFNDGGHDAAKRNREEMRRRLLTFRRNSRPQRRSSAARRRAFSPCLPAPSKVREGSERSRQFGIPF